MTKIKAMGLATTLLLAMGFAAQANPVTGATPVSGIWQITVGNAAEPCNVTFQPGDSGHAGTVSPAASCAGVSASLSRYSSRPGQLTLKSASGATIAVLAPEGSIYSGKQFADHRKVTLSPSQSNLAQGN